MPNKRKIIIDESLYECIVMAMSYEEIKTNRDDFLEMLLDKYYAE